MTGKRIGIVGGGQLGKMMILEAKRLGLYAAILDPAPDCPAHSISDAHIVARFDDPAGYKALAEKADVITYELEHIHTPALAALEKEGYPVYPSVQSLAVIQNKLTQKETLARQGVPVPRFAPVVSARDVTAAAEAFGYPLMLKTATGGYDGKGNALIRRADEAAGVYTRLGGDGRGLMAEEFVPFDKEISLIACRGIDGGRVVYPVAENIHRDSILDTTIVPARVSPEVVARATAIAARVMEVFAGVGAFCVELFVTADGGVLVNEVAPRPHNSGHYTIEGCFANQFENHIRAILGLPLGDVRLIAPTVMVNLLGESDGPATLTGLEEAYRHPRARVHLYGKSDSKTGRKMGHFTVTADTAADALATARRLKGTVRVSGDGLVS